jgi:hypothetical protein
MFYRKLILLLLVHFAFAYCFGNEIYGFGEEPNKFVVLGLLTAVVVTSIYAREQNVTGIVDGLLAGVQGIFAAVSGTIGSTDNALGLAIPYLLLGVAIAICYVRTVRAKQ